ELTEIEETETDEVMPESGITVCLDPGHGGLDPGGEYEGRIESTDNWELALAIKQEMENLGIQVVMTREDNDTKVFLKERVAIANASGADYFISIHRNTGDGYGYETWMTANATSLTEALTNNIHNAMVEVGVQRDRGVKIGTESGEGSDYYVIQNTTMPACLLEIGFMNVEEDNRLFDANREEYAKGIAEAVMKTHEEKDATEAAAPENSSEGEEDSEAENSLSKGLRLTYPAIDNVSALDSEILNWGQGTNVDEHNRPTGSLSYQEKFKDYTADFIIPTTKKTIYLTFDEGYEYGCTPSILSTLKEKNVKAVFFVTQPYAETDPDLVRQIIADGHILGNHSVTHPASGIPSVSLDEQRQEVMGLHEYIKENFDYEMCLFRFPAGKFSEQSLAVLNNCGYRSVFWSFAYLDYDVNNQPDEKESLEKMVSKLHPGAIYLLHAESWTNTNVLGDFIDRAREEGYEFGIYTDTLN
ncbi:MAG: N-acetylmuramoyl-L-alanine amidase, partial [Lachnospiraceae bacterium]|nr:N-acetylmuramoyl-L-alanine amidase [Lachnospiraceae bacterium]